MHLSSVRLFSVDSMQQKGNMDPNSPSIIQTSNASTESTAESYLEKLLSTAASKVKLNSFNFIDTQSLQNKMKFKLCNIETSDLSNSSYLPKLSRKDMMNPLDEYLSLPRVKLDDYGKSINQMISQKIEDILKNNIQVLLIGASIGAAVTAGVALGLLCVGSIIHSSIPSLWGNMTHRFKGSVMFSKKDATNYSSEANEQNSVHTVDHDDTTSKGRGHGTFTIIQGKPISEEFTSLTTTEDQCRQCLDSIISKMDSLKLTWKDVIKMNVMIVSGKCKASTIRNILNEFLPGSIPALSIAYVVQLENEASSIEMEVWLSS